MSVEKCFEIVKWSSVSVGVNKEVCGWESALERFPWGVGLYIQTNHILWADCSFELSCKRVLICLKRLSFLCILFLFFSSNRDRTNIKPNLGSGKGEHLRSGEENIMEWEPPCTFGGERMHLFYDFVMAHPLAMTKHIQEDSCN